MSQRFANIFQGLVDAPERRARGRARPRHGGPLAERTDPG